MAMKLLFILLLFKFQFRLSFSDPRREKVVAPIISFKKAEELNQPSAVLVSLDEVQVLFQRISSDKSFASNISGVLVESGAEIRSKLNGFSPTHKFPLAEFAPYHNTDYEWNSNGSGIMWKAYDFPVFLLPESSTLTLREAALKNENRKNSYTAHVAEFDLVMQTTKAGTHDSESCLKEETCLPLGGYSVWSSLPPINTSLSYQSKPIILSVVSMDSASFFRDKSIGAESPISLVFLVVTGEAWGYLGSRRFLLELDQQSDVVKGLNGSLIEMVMEIGSVGKGFNQGVKTFFTHTAGVSSATNKTLDALQRAQDSLKSENIRVLPADASNPGIPPSSLMAFLRKRSQTSGVVLEDFDRVFANKFYHSHLDDLSNVNSSAIVAAASLVARSLFILANENNDLGSSVLDSINVNVSLVEELMSCLLSCEPGLSCELVKNYISPDNACPNHYVGVVIGEPSSNPGYVDDISRFVLNFLAEVTSIQKENASSSCLRGCTNNEVCIRAETEGKGVCVISTTRYVPAYSTRLKFESGTWNVLPSDSSDPLGLVDPVWTESNWDVIGLRVYTVQNASYDRLVLLGGVTITILACLAIVLTRRFITKALKQD